MYIKTEWNKTELPNPRPQGSLSPNQTRETKIYVAACDWRDHCCVFPRIAAKFDSNASCCLTSCWCHAQQEAMFLNRLAKFGVDKQKHCWEMTSLPVWRLCCEIRLHIMDEVTHKSKIQEREFVQVCLMITWSKSHDDWAKCAGGNVKKGK